MEQEKTLNNENINETSNYEETEIMIHRQVIDEEITCQRRKSSGYIEIRKAM